MNRSWAVMLVIALGWVEGGLAAGTALAESGRSDSETPAECCFNNARYTGTCVVQPAVEETCAGILAYLNNPSSSGKSYCNFTEIRGGWKEIACPEESARWSVSVPVQNPDRVGAGPLPYTASDQTHEEAYPECWN